MVKLNLDPAIQPYLDKIKDLEATVVELKSFLWQIESGWDCDIGANSSHPHYCRVCCAAKLLEKYK